MKRYTVYAVYAVGLAMLTVALVAQTPPVTGDRSSPLRPLTGEGNVGVSNAVLRDQPEIRVLRVVVEPGGTRPIHAHSGVQYHLFVPVSGPMELNLDGGRSVQVRPWHPYFLQKAPNTGSTTAAPRRWRSWSSLSGEGTSESSPGLGLAMRLGQAEASTK